MNYERDDDYYESRDWIHASEMPDTDKMGDLLEVVVKQLYTSFNEDLFQDKLEELCDMLGVKMPTCELSIERKQRWAKTA